MRPSTPAVHSTGCRPARLVEEAPQARKGHDVKAVLPVLVLVLSTGLVRPATAQVLAPPPPNPFLGGVPSGSATSTPLALSIGDAIERALAHNLGVLTAEDSAEHARGERRRTLSELLPNVNGHVSETRQKVNLAAFGFPLPAGIPSVVGPFDVFDARVGVSQSVFDLGAINDARAQAHDVLAARYTVKSARDLVVLVAANLYLRALAESARADSADAQLKTAQALFDQAGDLKQSGLVAGIDVLRAQVQLSTEQQRATAAHNEFEKSKLQLARVIGLPLGQAFTLVRRSCPYAPVPDDDARGGARSRLQGASGLPRGARAAEGRRSLARGDRRLGAALGASQRGLRRDRADRRQLGRHLRDRRRRERADLPGRQDAGPAASRPTRTSGRAAPRRTT